MAILDCFFSMLVSALKHLFLFLPSNLLKADFLSFRPQCKSLFKVPSLETNLSSLLQPFPITSLSDLLCGIHHHTKSSSLFSVSGPMEYLEIRSCVRRGSLLFVAAVSLLPKTVLLTEENGFLNKYQFCLFVFVCKMWLLRADVVYLDISISIVYAISISHGIRFCSKPYSKNQLAHHQWLQLNLSCKRRKICF